MIWIWFLGGMVALAVVCVLVSWGLFQYALKGKPSKDLAETAEKSHWAPFAKEIRAEKQWFFAQNPKEVFIRNREGLLLKAYFLPAEQEAKGLMILMHGFRSNATNDFCKAAHFYHDLGMHQLLVEQRAQGQSQGDYLGFGVLERYDCLDWVNAARKQWKGDLFLHGVSMGAATVLMANPLFPKGAVQGIVADCGFTTPRAIFTQVLKAHHVPRFPFLWLCNCMAKAKAGYGFSDASAFDAMAQNREIPILFIHGQADTFVPPEMTLANFRACHAEKELLLVPKAKHAESIYVDFAAWSHAVSKFLNHCTKEK